MKVVWACWAIIPHSCRRPHSSYPSKPPAPSPSTHLLLKLVQQQLLGRLAQHHLLRLPPLPPRGVGRALEGGRRPVKDKHRPHFVEQKPPRGREGWEEQDERGARGKLGEEGGQLRNWGRCGGTLIFEG